MLTPPFFAAAILLVVSGLAKLRHPEPAINALRRVRVPARHWTVRSIGAVEFLVGVACLVAPRRPAAIALAVLYASFAGFLLLLIRAGVPGASCGCLGDREAPPSVLHVLLNVGAAVTAALVAAAPPPGIVAFAGRQPLLGLPFLLGTILIAYLAYLAVAFAPQLFAAYAGRTPRSAGSSRSWTFTIGSPTGR